MLPHRLFEPPLSIFFDEGVFKKRFRQRGPTPDCWKGSPTIEICICPSIRLEHTIRLHGVQRIDFQTWRLLGQRSWNKSMALLLPSVSVLCSWLKKAAGHCKTPKRLKDVLPLLEKLLCRHARCRYVPLRNTTCPSKVFTSPLNSRNSLKYALDHYKQRWKSRKQCHPCKTSFSLLPCYNWIVSLPGTDIGDLDSTSLSKIFGGEHLNWLHWKFDNTIWSERSSEARQE